MSDLISRQAALNALNGLIDRLEQILRDIRETNGDDSVCGMCEYDGAYIGQSGDWCNECPGFDKDDCFKLSDECRKRWLESVEMPSAEPERKVGKWIFKKTFPNDESEFPIGCLICSECGSHHSNATPCNFCDNCGADMRGEHDA